MINIASTVEKFRTQIIIAQQNNSVCQLDEYDSGTGHDLVSCSKIAVKQVNTELPTNVGYRYGNRKHEHVPRESFRTFHNQYKTSLPLMYSERVALYVRRIKLVV